MKNIHEYAARIAAGTVNVSDERARTFREMFTAAPWDDVSNGWNLDNIKWALAASDDQEVVDVIVGLLDAGVE